ncbi:hypothetical protein MSAN_00233200 [Mycena sanguinolenta]|uniref:Uncharacterized protein n=1 Tax=Mycena sanguinolenta TaxID=230812 RepID=A0A8H6ZFK9_9AGAR|nr:hypothetical protein MSAN_00233200 [Mycena sanguinolenta]
MTSHSTFTSQRMVLQAPTVSYIAACHRHIAPRTSTVDCWITREVLKPPTRISTRFELHCALRSSPGQRMRIAPAHHDCYSIFAGARPHPPPLRASLKFILPAHLSLPLLRLPPLRATPLPPFPSHQPARIGGRKGSLALRRRRDELGGRPHPVPVPCGGLLFRRYSCVVLPGWRLGFGGDVVERTGAGFGLGGGDVGVRVRAEEAVERGVGVVL